MQHLDDMKTYMDQPKVLFYEINTDPVRTMKVCHQSKNALGMSPKAKVRLYHSGMLNSVCHAIRPYSALVIEFPNKKEAAIFKLRYPGPDELLNALPL